MEQLRTRTRRRLIGAGVLVTGAVVLLPMALESNPRPPSAPVTIDMPGRPGVAGPAVDALAPRAAPLRAGEVAASGADLPVLVPGVESGASAAPSAERSAATVAAKPVAVPRPAPRVDAPAPRKLAAPVKTAADKPAPTKSAHADAKAHAERKDARAEGKAASATKKPAEARVFVQVGAYAEANTVKSVRQRVDKLGMKSHEQTVETASGQRTRVRLGPFASREEADRAAAKLRAGGLGATVVAP